MEKEYRYLCTDRPPQLGFLPKEGLRYIESYRAQRYDTKMKRLSFGYAVYNRPLTEAEIGQHKLIRAAEG